MGCGQKAVAEDEDEWEDFKKDVGVSRTNWQVYSREATFAKEGWRSYQFDGTLLEKYVNLCMEFDKAKTKFTDNLNLLKQIRAL